MILVSLHIQVTIGLTFITNKKLLDSDLYYCIAKEVRCILILILLRAREMI